MKFFKSSLIVIAIFGLFACATYPTMPMAYVNDSTIYEGQSADLVIQLLGPPDIVSSGSLLFSKYGCYFNLNPTKSAVEWVFIGPHTSTIVYLNFGRVVVIGQLPTEKIRR